MTPARRVGAVLVTGAVAFAAVTIYALEGQEVVVLRTRTPDGEIRGPPAVASAGSPRTPDAGCRT